jgi:photosystem II stability/assembly factor-like uncharacterized protein
MRTLIALLVAVLTVVPPAWAGWELTDPGTGDPNGVVFCDAQHGLVTASSGTGFVFGGAEGSPIRWTGDGGMNWDGGKVEEALEEASSPNLLAGGKGWCLGKRKDNGGTILLVTADYGQTWKRQTLPDNLPPREVSFLPPEGRQAWMLTDANQVWTSSDGGQTWSEKRLPVGLFAYVAGWWPVDEQHLFLAGEGGGKLVIARTADGGATWTSWMGAARGEGGELVAISLAPGAAPGALGQSGWAIGGEGRMVRNSGGWAQWTVPLVLHTTDGGATWTRQKLPVKPRLTCVSAISDQEAWVGTFGGYALPTWVPASLMHTTDGGETWRDERPAICSVRGLFWLDKNHGWAIGGQGGSPVEPARIMYVWTPGE